MQKKRSRKDEARYRYNKASFLAIVGLASWAIAYAASSTEFSDAHAFVLNWTGIAIIFIFGGLFWAGGIWNYLSYVRIMEGKNTPPKGFHVADIPREVAHMLWKFFF